MQTDATLIHQGLTNNHDTDVTDRYDDFNEAEEDEDATARENATSPVPIPSQDSHRPRKSASSRPKSSPPPLSPLESQL